MTCEACHLGRYDVLALLGVAALAAGAWSGSGAILVCGIAVISLGALAIHRNREG